MSREFDIGTIFWPYDPKLDAPGKLERTFRRYRDYRGARRFGDLFATGMSSFRWAELAPHGWYRTLTDESRTPTPWSPTEDEATIFPVYDSSYYRDDPEIVVERTIVVPASHLHPSGHVHHLLRTHHSRTGEFLAGETITRRLVLDPDAVTLETVVRPTESVIRFGADQYSYAKFATQADAIAAAEQAQMTDPWAAPAKVVTFLAPAAPSESLTVADVNATIDPAAEVEITLTAHQLAPPADGAIVGWACAFNREKTPQSRRRGWWTRGQAAGPGRDGDEVRRKRPRIGVPTTSEGASCQRPPTR